jgi:hypothetical protein
MAAERANTMQSNTNPNFFVQNHGVDITLLSISVPAKKEERSR